MGGPICVEPGKDPVCLNYINTFPISSISDNRRFYLPRTFADPPSNPYCAYSSLGTEESHGPFSCQASTQHSSTALPSFTDALPTKCGGLLTCQKPAQVAGLQMREASETSNTFALMPLDVFDDGAWNCMISQPRYVSNGMEDTSTSSTNSEDLQHISQLFGNQSSTQFLNDVPEYSCFSAVPAQPLCSEIAWTSFDSTTTLPADIWTASESKVEPENCGPTIPKDDLQQGTSVHPRTSSSVRVGDHKAIRAETEKRIKLIQRTPAKAVATIILDAIDPDKSKLHPYTIKAQVMPPPPYWAADVSHNTPAHLSGDAPLNLLLHFFLMPQVAPEKYQTLLSSITCRDCRWCEQQHATLYGCMSCVVQKSKLNLHDNARRDVGPEVNQAGRHWPRLEVLMSILNITQEVEKLARSEIDGDAEIILPEFPRELLLKNGCQARVKRKKVVPPQANARRRLIIRASTATAAEQAALEAAPTSVKRIKISSGRTPSLQPRQQNKSTNQSDQNCEPPATCASFGTSQVMDDVVDAGGSMLHPDSDWPDFCNADAMDMAQYLTLAF